MAIEREKVLFSCVGTTDPVRGGHDGPMMHILRTERPSFVYIFLSKEIKKYADEDHRFDECFAWMKEKWGYSPEYDFYNSEIEKVHNMDILQEKMVDAFKKLADRFPDAEILVNLTSGTPQMQILLALLAMEPRYHACGIQVSNYKPQSGGGGRTNENYGGIAALNANQDEAENAENRCFKPKMYAIRREQQKERISTLLEKRDFAAILALEEDALPTKLTTIVQHLEARSRLDLKAAKQYASGLDLGFSLFPVRAGDRTFYEPIVEYLLLLQNLEAAESYTEYVFRMEPLFLNIQKELLEQRMRKRGYSFRNDILETVNNNKEDFVPKKLEKLDNELYKDYENWTKKKGWVVRRCDLNCRVADVLLQKLDNVPRSYFETLEIYKSLKNARDQIAHQFRAVDANQIQKLTERTPEEVTKVFERLISDTFAACDPAIFEVTEKCIDYIKDYL